MNGICITGTDTGIGKTFIAEGIIRELRKRGIKVIPMKPVETGCISRREVLYPADTARLLNAAEIEESIDLVNPYRFREPVAPYVAAMINKTEIKKRKILNAMNTLIRRYEFLIMETAGGLLVPITEDYLNIDMIKDSGLPLIIVSRPDLGTINHTLLTITVARSRGINIIGVIFNYSRKKKKGIPEKTNPEIISKFGKVNVLGIVPYSSSGSSNKRLDKIFSPIVDKILTINTRVVSI